MCVFPDLMFIWSHKTCTKNQPFFRLKKFFSVTFFVFLYIAHTCPRRTVACVQFEHFLLLKLHKLLKNAQVSLTFPENDAILCFVRKT